jgi:hypothetical protein
MNAQARRRRRASRADYPILWELGPRRCAHRQQRSTRQMLPPPIGDYVSLNEIGARSLWRLHFEPDRAFLEAPQLEGSR